MGVPFCSTTERRCYLGCEAAGACTADGLTCRTYAGSGTFGYCL